ncbi:hypothetical protein HMN09_01179900 [Mycena chlorophos]|uniref:Uncharacterized protein n=1 Tax=Mycena chlorophos TaxID=658473 RepID=A0A8H6S670_MYCCL|nr:hypothetical protein HMN09_01179900 [Mycena chlorophos]
MGAAMRAASLAALCSFSYAVSALQVPLSLPLQRHQNWENLDDAPSPNGTSHLIFDTVNNLLQHWPNTRYRQGHNIVPGTIAVGNLLFHGRADPFLPIIPEWTATDPEHAYHFCGSPGIPRRPKPDPDNPPPPSQPHLPQGPGCWQLTLVAKRPLKVIYFDGSSAANLKDGTLDTQDMLAWGTPSPERWLDERQRLDDLCAWGKEFGVDGFVRMEMDFEVMLCEFQTTVDLVAADYLASWFTPDDPDDELVGSLSDPRAGRRAMPHPLAPSPSEQPFLVSPEAPGLQGLSIPVRIAADVIKFSTLQAGAWHNHFPGDLRITVDYTKLISFYDTSLVPSLRLAEERWDHRAGAISQADAERAIRRLEDGLRLPGSGSGIDWRALYRGVVDRWAERLETLRYMLEGETDLVLVQRHLRIMLTPYIRESVRPLAALNSSTDSGWAAPIWPVCATRFTASIRSTPDLLDAMTPGEHTLLRAVDDTTREICRQVVRMWSWGVEAGLDRLLSAPSIPSSSFSTPSVKTRWLAETHALMAWLDWPVWVKCDPACSVEQTCYLPTWPYFMTRINRHPTDEERRKAAWRTPQPRCIRLWEPYDNLRESNEL